MNTTDRLRGMPEPPKGWDVRPLKRAANINRRALADETSEDFEFPYIDIASVDGNGRIELSDPIRFGNAPSRARRVVRPGDTVISTVRTYLKAIGRIRCEHEGAIASTGFAVLTPQDDVHPDYLWRFVQTDEFVGLVQANSIGIGYPSIAPSELGALPVFVPPMDTQRAIADFLDRETAKIDTLIEKKQRLLELLDEKRTALITRAVTRGLDPDVPMKDSGVEWIGQIPGHWEVAKVRHLCTVGRGASPRPIDDPQYFSDDGKYGWVRIEDVTKAEKYLSETKQYLSDLGVNKSVPLEAGSLVLSIAATVGKPIILGGPFCIHDGFVYFSRLRQERGF